MKTIAFTSFAIGASSTGLGVLFKMMHWPGASILLVIGLGTLSLVFFPSFAKLLYDKLK